ncbi:SDR family NAD(P)-dependent oxidoreductase [Actinomadura harenae]|uniref:SDR family NAD(P)-dependent oxidoreductase n=1 Tax=Actinomadura harenae TaxID=2483351 RepID=A0A3M2L885_9ACTN|nr:SDR family NAD(P)-dependent oxidoreductase [Actinomadura harenae]RMI33811.1 SDR family NAD(P)-dependent oxidoreductase [Actinomadura harenae]
MSERHTGTAVIIGAGPGLGMSMAHRLGREGHPIALVSRTGSRHAAYLAELADAGVTASSFPVDVRDPERLRDTLTAIAAWQGPVDVLYYGPGAVDDPNTMPRPITETSGADVNETMKLVLPAVDAVQAVLPGMRERRSGTLLFAGGMSSVVPLPPLGAHALAAAALRNYALTLNAALTPDGVYAGTLTIGGVIDRGDIHRHITADPARYGDLAAQTLNPDDIANEAWLMTTKRDRAETVFTLTPTT